MNSVTRHIPVMFDQVLSFLRASEGGRFLDCTLGGAGHTEGILRAHPDNRVVAADRDMRAIERARVRLASFGDRVELRHVSFEELASELSGERFTGMLADLGISTDQLFESRGFSFKDETPLDMRMDEGRTLTARDLVNELPERELYVLLRQGGMGPEAKQVVHAIVRARPLEKTNELAEVVAATLRGQHRDKQVHPATVVFQALRMKVNEERSQIEALLNSAPTLVQSGGRLVVITFHSIEDKVVTQRMRGWQQGGEFSALMPGARPAPALGRMVEKKAVAPDAEEISRNPSARSARLRIFEFV
ncbi:MAG: 16S rRNA (cytosine(1402)-N(4))-methyltransferase RsmH [Proteobacteria bacterium]|nr:16S rRNA (cytosine(1402)-N(4))-methyltransferase RsmH [Pseudomonadota bacterium]